MDKLTQLVDERNKSESMTRIRRINQINYILRIFDGNFRELINLINSYENDITAWDLRERSRLDTIINDFARLLFNYTASVMSLVDHTRNFYTKYYLHDPNFIDYNNKIESIFKFGLEHQFFQGLRNYTIHVQTPPVGAVNSFGQDGERSELYLSKSTLLEWNNWPQLARIFIESQQNDIIIKPIVIHYHTDVIDFHNWLRSRFFEAHSHDLQEIEKLELEIRPLQADALMGMIRWNMQDHANQLGQPFDTFAGLIPHDTFAYIDRFELAQQKIISVFEYLESYYRRPFDDSIKQFYITWAIRHDESQP